MHPLSYDPVLTIAGSDSCGGAGIQADIKTISSLGCYAMSVITAVTAQNTLGVTAIQGIYPAVVQAQIDAVFTDIRPLAVKTGMLYSTEIINAVADALLFHGVENLVIDPVMVSTSGSRLLNEDAQSAMVERLFPLALLVTPNVAEAIALTGIEGDPDAQAARLREMGARNVLLKMGDRPNTEGDDHKTDLLYLLGHDNAIPMIGPAVGTTNTHGTGCTLSAAIASYLALGRDLDNAVHMAKHYITMALTSGSFKDLGHGHGPVDHFWKHYYG